MVVSRRCDYVRIELPYWTKCKLTTVGVTAKTPPSDAARLKEMPKIVDLTHTLDSDIHTYPEDPKFSAKPAFEFPKGNGCRVHALCLGTHTGTHADAPYHFYKDGKRIDEVPLEWLIGRPVVIDLSSLVSEEGFRIEWEHLVEYEEEIRKAGQGDKILLIRTGWDTWFSRERSQTYLLHPYFTRDVAAKLLEHGIRIFCVDTLNPDSTYIEPAVLARPTWRSFVISPAKLNWLAKF
ncbi:putative cyclase [Thelephora ganbajun]|uniref:Cyclase n=1 Tax=Thelephora ganbajun TaxID=370292 RepID=A0ACB6ZA09_THEGA|nr:putative cyclase [Thelephora ganbajun]